MAQCPYGTHRLKLSEVKACLKCNHDLQLLVMIQEMPVACYNQGRRFYGQGQLEEAEHWLHSALLFPQPVKEAHWLLGVLYRQKGELGRARIHLQKALEMGCPVDLGWAKPDETEEDEPPTASIDDSAFTEAATELEAPPADTTILPDGSQN